MNASEYLEASWRYWGHDASPDKPDAAELSDDELYEVQLFTAPALPTRAYAEVMQEWDQRRLRVKVYRDTSPRRKR